MLTNPAATFPFANSGPARGFGQRSEQRHRRVGSLSAAGLSVSNAWLNRVWSDSQLRGHERVVLLALADRAGDDGTCWPSIADLAQRSNLSERHVRRIIGRLIQVGKIGAASRVGGRGKTSVYQLLDGKADIYGPGLPQPADEKADTAMSGFPSVKADRGDQKADTALSAEPQEPKKKRRPPSSKKKSPPQRTPRFPDPERWDIVHEILGLEAQKWLAGEFRAAWKDWVAYRREIHKRLAAPTIRAQLKKLKEYGHDGAVQSIRRSIEHGWQGLFDPEDDRGGVPANARRQKVQGPRDRPRQPGGLEEDIEVQDYHSGG